MEAAARPRERAWLVAIRYGGLVGALLLAVAGARSGQGGIAVSAWLAGTVLLVGAWLVLGRRLSGVRLRWILLTGALWAVPLLASLPLESRDVYAYACQGSLVAHGMDPYTHGVADLPCPWLSEVPRLWRHTASPYGSLWLLIAGGAAGGTLPVAIAVFRAVALVGIVLTGWAGQRLARALGTDPVKAAWLALVSPVMVIHAVSGGHNDALVAGLLVAAVAVAVALPPTPVRPFAAGALLGLAVAVKATPLVMLPFLALLLAADRRWRSLIRTGALVSVGTAGVYAVLWALSGYGLGWLPALSDATRRVQEPTSLPTGLGMGARRALHLVGAHGLAGHAIGAFRALGLVVLVAVLIGLWWWARGRTGARDVVVAAGLAMLATVLLAPWVFPWYGLAPLAILGYSLRGDRPRYLLGLLAAASTLLILPDGSGLTSLHKRPAIAADYLLLAVLAAVGLRYLLRRRRAAAVVSGSVDRT